MAHFGFPLEALVIFFAVIALSVTLDLVAHRRSHEITVLNASLWTGFWVALALGFYGYLWARFSKEWADLYLAGYVLEETLSIDNLMVFMAIFASFGIKGALQHRILYWGIVGAMLFRALFVVAGTSLFQLTPWVGFAFALIVAWTGWKMMTKGEAADEIHDYSDHWSVRLVGRVMPVFPRLAGDRFFLRGAQARALAAEGGLRLPRDGRLFATPAFLCLIAIETSDVMFAFDSVPAVIAVTQEPLLVYAAMIFAVLGLRSLYFVLAALTRYLVHLEKAVVALLFFIAFKLTVQAGEHVFGWNVVDISPGAVAGVACNATRRIGLTRASVDATLQPVNEARRPGGPVRCHHDHGVNTWPRRACRV